MTLNRKLIPEERDNGNGYSFFKMLSMSFVFLYICSLYVLAYKPAYSVICDIFFLGAVACSVINFFLERNTFKLDYTFFSLLLFVGYAALTTFWVECEREVIGLVLTLVQLFGFYIIIRLNIQSEKDFRNIIYSIYIGAVIMCLYTILFYGPGEIIRRISMGQRIGAEINQMNGMGLYCTVLFIMTMYFIIFEKKKWAYAVLPVSLFVLVGAGSRKSFLLVALAFLLMEMFKSKKGRAIRVLAILSVICVAVYFVMELAETNKFFYRFAQVFNIFAEEEAVTDVSLNTRSYMIEYGLELFSKKPVQGYGPMQFEYFYSLLHGVRRPPHSTFIQILVGFGLIGFTLFYGMYVYVIRKLVPMIRKHRKYSIMIITIVIMFLANDIGGNMLNHKFIYMFFAIYASYINMKLDDEKKVSLE